MIRSNKEECNEALAVMLRDLAQTDMKDIPKRLNQSANNAPQILADLIDTLQGWSDDYKEGNMPVVVGLKPEPTGYKKTRR